VLILVKNFILIIPGFLLVLVLL